MFPKPIEIKDAEYEEVTSIYHNVSDIRIDYDWCFGLLYKGKISAEFFFENIEEMEEYIKNNSIKGSE